MAYKLREKVNQTPEIPVLEALYKLLILNIAPFKVIYLIIVNKFLMQMRKHPTLSEL